MTALFLVLAGAVLGQCDQQCYDAKGKPCTCPCGRRNHGVGYEQALANTRLMEFGEQRVVFGLEVHQPSLFGLQETA